LGLDILFETGEKQTKEQYCPVGFQSSVSEIVQFWWGQWTIIKSLNIVLADGKSSFIRVYVNQQLNLNYSDATVSKEFNKEISNYFFKM